MDKHTMSDAKRVDDGGAAFPQSDLSGYGMGPSDGPQGGMSLRDWFAGQALAGLLAGGLGDTIPHDDVTAGQQAADFSYGYADAMLRARKEPSR